MKKYVLSMTFALLMVSLNALAGDAMCYGYSAPRNTFDCTTHGNCTWWVAYKRPDIRGVITGSAGPIFYENARLQGFNIGQDPRNGAIVVFSGHVAYVENTNSDGSFDVSEMDYTGRMGSGKLTATYKPLGNSIYQRNNGTTRWTLLGFIYNRKFVPVPGQQFCARGKGVFGICWEVNTNVSCQGGKNWEVFPIDWELESAYRVSTSKYCPDDGGIGGGEDPSAPPPITGRKNAGALPDLVVPQQYLVLNDGDKTVRTQIHIGERSNCAIQIKNVGNKGAYDDFQNRCYLSKGKWRDRNPPSPGHATIKGSVGLKSGVSRFVYIQIEAFKYPGSYNLTACTDTDNKIKESDDGNQCQEEFNFDVVSDVNLVISAITPSKTTLQPNEAFSVSVTTRNAGENFGRDTQSTALYLDGIFVENRWITKEALQGGMSKTEVFTLASGTASLGTHTLMACANSNGLIPETNGLDNCTSMPYQVRLPSVYTPPSDPPLVTSCPKPVDPDFTAMPTIPSGDVGAVIFGNTKQRIFLPTSTLAQAKTSLVWGGMPTFDPSLVTKICWSSIDTNWGVALSTACASNFTLQGTNWIADIPNTPQSSKGTWSFKQGTTEYWVNPSTITTLTNDSDGHIRYNGWTPNAVTVSDDVSGMTLNAAFSSKNISGFWLPTNTIPNGKVFWNNNQDTYPGMPGRLNCDVNGKLIASIPNVAPTSTGRLLLGLTDATQYGWQTTNQWILPAGAFSVNTAGDYKLPLSASVFQKIEAVYDKNQQKLTLTISGDSRMLNAFYGLTSIDQVTAQVWFDAWIVPTGQVSKLIQGTITRSSAGVWTLVFTGLPPSFGGNAYLTRINGVLAWQSVSAFAFGSGIVVDVTAADYVMPK